VNAVITGDITESSKLNIEQREILLEALKKSFEDITIYSNESIQHSDIQIFRGDSFQGIIINPKYSLKASIIIRASLKKSLKVKPYSVAGKNRNIDLSSNQYDKNLRIIPKYATDARIAIGIGEIDFPPEKEFKGSEDGEAFRRSGPTLDKIKKQKSDVRLVVDTPWDEINNEMNVSFGLLDALIEKWTSAQAEALLCLFQGLNQTSIANKLHLSQASINVRLKSAGWYAIENLIKRFEYLIGKMCEIPNSNQS